MFHVVTPYSRECYLPKVAASLKDQNVIWHIIPAHGTEVPKEIAKLPWVNINIYKYEHPPVDWCYSKLNYFINEFPIIDTDYYGFLNDDDLATPKMFDKLRQAAKSKPEVIFLSMHYAAEIDLIAQTSNSRISKVGLEQFYVRGDILKQHRFRIDCPAADGHMAVTLFKCRQHVMLPKVFVIFNALEPHRWTDEEIKKMMGKK